MDHIALTFALTCLSGCVAFAGASLATLETSLLDAYRVRAAIRSCR